jgi:hypothetical protein
VPGQVVGDAKEAFAVRREAFCLPHLSSGRQNSSWRPWCHERSGRFTLFLLGLRAWPALVSGHASLVGVNLAGRDAKINCNMPQAGSNLFSHRGRWVADQKQSSGDLRVTSEAGGLRIFCVTTQHVRCTSIFLNWIPAFAGMTYLLSHFLVRHADESRRVPLSRSF